MRKDDLIQQIKYLKKFKGISYTWIGKQVNLSGTRMSHFVNGGYLSEKKLERINDFITGFTHEIY